MSRQLVLALSVASVLSLFVGACGDDGDDDDDVVAVDAAAEVDGATPDIDAGPSACQSLCNCTSTVCAQDLTECLTACESLSTTALSCRTQHCGFAQTDATTHCPHARGESLCD